MEDRPISDPSELTTAQILREVGTLRELMESRHDGSARLFAEQFSALEKQLRIADAMRIEQKKDMKDALDAALAAAKEAVSQQNASFAIATAKSETSMSEQMKQANVMFGTAIEALTTQLNDLKERIARVEAAKQGGDGAVNNRRMENGQLVSILGFGVSVIAIIYVIVGAR